jgi:hypothetical protein
MRKLLLIGILFLLPILMAPAAAAAAPPSSIVATMSWDGHNIPTNSATGQQGIGTVCVEMHLSTNKSSPWALGAYEEIPGLPSGYQTVNYMTAPGGGRTELSSWLSGSQKTVFPGGAFGHMTPDQEMWYVNMRWEYVDWYQNGGGTHTRNVDWTALRWHLAHRELLVTNLSTGKSAIAYMGDSGPALGLGNPAGNRIAGLSPDLMFYLGNQGGAKDSTRTALGRDDSTQYSFAWVTDQGLPLGPATGKIIPAKPANLNLVTGKMATGTRTAPVVPLKNFQHGYVTVTADQIALTGIDWTAVSVPYLLSGEKYSVLEHTDGWYKIYLPADRSSGWIAEEYVAPGTLPGDLSQAKVNLRQRLMR